MSQKELKDVSASVRQRLLDISRERKEAFEFVLRRYTNERLLYRISVSNYTDSFILKGAALFIVWNEDRYRPTRDLDFLGFGESSTQQLKSMFHEICIANIELNGLVKSFFKT